MNLALGTTLILCALASMPASAQDTDRLALQRAATGQGFTIGDTNFRLVPNARVLRNTTPPPRADVPAMRRSTTAAAGVTLQHIGPYVISSGNSPRSPRTTPVGDVEEPSLMVAINQRNGQPVVASPRLQVYAGDADAIVRLARQTNGAVLAASQDGTGVIGYRSVPEALAALPTVRRGGDVDDVVLQVIQAVPRLR
ncbi:hypothetical protein ABQE70_00660 [Xanthomonas campestris pv. campestris]|uniref:hypothetical protein n=1 Tax=Xanthomonas campestris TaxID=339 RepID=UPI0032E3FBAB